MEITIHDDKAALGAAAAREGADAIRAAIARNGRATIIVATGASQFEMLERLVREDLDWSKVTAFHLDEYVGLPVSHPASFRGYLQTRFVEPLGSLGEFVPVQGDAADIETEIERLNARLSEQKIDVCFAGLGENCHLAFNDPPADFDTEAPYLRVRLDAACRRQQLGEGWFATIEDVPAEAISMSVRQIMKSRRIVLSVSDARKAGAVKMALKGPVSAMAPGSILQRHDGAAFHLDKAAAALLGARAI